MFESRYFNSLQAGPHLLMLGGVHGDEPCGTIALERLCAELSSGELPLLKGRLTLIPRANPFALKANQRYTQENLNRIIGKWDSPQNAERRLASIICEQMEGVDAVLDLHAVTAESASFTMLDVDTPAHRDWLTALNVPYVLTGWNELYPNETGTTVVTHAHRLKKPAFVVECGRKDDPASSLEAYAVARATLAYFGLTAPYARPEVAPQYLRYTQVEYKKREGEFAAPWLNFSPIRAGAVIARYTDGGELKAPEDSFIIMPKASAVVGEEWFYLAVAEAAQQDAKQFAG